MQSPEVNAGINVSKTCDTITVAACCDQRYAMPLAVTFNSMLRSLKKGSVAYLYIVTTDISEETRIRLRNACNVEGIEAHLEFVAPDVGLVDGFHVRGYMSKAAYYRLQLPNLLPESVDKVIYLDSDLLVQGCLSDLWNESIGDYSILAVEDMMIQTVSDSDGLYNWKELGYAADHPYFNSGVLVIPLNKWRRENTTARLLEYLSGDTSQFNHHDQEALNAVLGHEWGRLDLTWNSLPLYLQPDLRKWAETPFKRRLEANFHELAFKPAICHFVSDKKPWTAGYRPPLQTEWLSTLRTSGWFTQSEFSSWHRDWLCRHYTLGIRNKISAYAGKRFATQR